MIKKKRGKSAIGNKPNKTYLKKLYINESKSIRQIAKVMGCSKDMVYRSLHEYEIQIRPNKRRSSLEKYDISLLEKEIKVKGIRGLARELRIDESTLRHHMRVRKSKR